MALSIISNQAASIAARQLGQANDAATSTAEKLSSGKRVNSAADDAAASAIAARLSAEIAGLQTAGVNAGQASSLLQIADGAFQNVEDILTRAKSLAVQAGSDQISDTERSFLDQEFQALKGEIDRIAADTEFNGTKLVNGEINITGGNANLTEMAGVEDIQFQAIQFDLGDTTVSNAMANVAFASANNTFMVTLQDNGGAGFAMGTVAIDSAVTDGGNTLVSDTVLAVDLAVTGQNTPAGQVQIQLNGGLFMTNSDQADTAIVFTGGDSMDFTFKVGTGVTATEDEITVGIGSITSTALGIGSNSIDTKDNADVASTAVSNAIDLLQAKRSDVGAAQNRLDFATENVNLARENQEAARSELEDLNVARAITEFSQQQLLVQAGTSTLSQANNLPQNLLQLFN